MVGKEFLALKRRILEQEYSHLNDCQRQAVYQVNGPLQNEAFFGPIIIMVVLTTVITPILLKIVFKDRENDPDVYASSELIEDYEKIEQNEKLAQKVLEQS